MVETGHRQKVLDSILVKPAGPDCNLACEYCFYLEKSRLFSKSKTHRMADDALEAAISKLMSAGSTQVSIGWQGGEPTLMGRSFFERAVELEKRFGQGRSVGNSLQTNGLLLDGKWASFLASYNFLVGLSIDGPARVHDRYRKSQNGRGSWDRVADTAKLLLDRGVMANALAVVTDYSALFPEEIYYSLKDLGLAFQQYIPCVEPAPSAASGHPASFSVSPEAFGEFLGSLFDLWLGDFKDGAPTTTIRFFDSVLRSCLSDRPTDCTMLETCGVYLVVEHNGDVFPCDFFVDEDLRLGNVLSDSLLDLFVSEKMLRFGSKKKELPSECKDCRWLSLCRGGCPKDRPFANGNLEPSYFCRSYKLFFEHAHERLESYARFIESENLKGRQKEVVDAIRLGLLDVRRNDPCPCGSGKKLKKCCLATATGGT